MKKSKITFILVLMFWMLITSVQSISAAETTGSCGENLTWELDVVTGTLTITGQGAMEDREHSIWGDFRDSIERVVIDEGVTSVGRNAFFGFTKLQTVSLPASLKTIGHGAFHGCRALENISLTNVTFIDKYAFAYCSGLTELTIPEGVTEISYGAFSGCLALKKVNFHKGVTVIGSYAFSGCDSLNAIILPNNVKVIESSAFSSCNNLSEVILSNELTSLGSNAFSSCSSLKKIIIPDKVTEIRLNTFNGCTSLQDVIIGAGVSQITPEAFRGCSSVTAFTLSGSNENYSVDKGVLYNKNRTELILMPPAYSGEYAVLPGTKEIRNYSCWYVSGLTSLIIPESVISIGDHAFDHCTNLQRVTFAEGLETIGHEAFGETSISEITFPATLKEMGVHIFFYCDDLSKIVFTGDAPTVKGSELECVDTTVYYPDYTTGWEDAIKRWDKDDTFDRMFLTFISYSCEDHKIVKDFAKSPTCTENGLTEGMHCDVCGMVMVAQDNIPARGHTFSTWTEQSSGERYRYCTICSWEETGSNLGNDKHETEQLEAEKSETESFDSAQVDTKAKDSEDLQESGTETQVDDSDNSVQLKDHKNTIICIVLFGVIVISAISVVIILRNNRKKNF